MSIRMTKGLQIVLYVLVMIFALAFLVGAMMAGTWSSKNQSVLDVLTVIWVGSLAAGILLSFFLVDKSRAHKAYATITNEQFPYDNLDFLRQTKRAAGILREVAMKANEIEKQLAVIQKSIEGMTYLTDEENQSLRSQIESVRAELRTQEEDFSNKWSVFHKVGMPVESDMLAYQTMAQRGK